MTRTPYSKSFREHAAVSRALSVLLLVLVVYGTTVEAAHRHGRILGSADPVRASSVSNAGDAGILLSGLVGCSDCLICQLHQNFSATLVTIRAAGSPLRNRLELLRPAAIAFKSQADAPQQGRAPPFTS